MGVQRTEGRHLEVWVPFGAGFVWVDRMLAYFFICHCKVFNLLLQSDRSLSYHCKLKIIHFYVIVHLSSREKTILPLSSSSSFFSVAQFTHRERRPPLGCSLRPSTPLPSYSTRPPTPPRLPSPMQPESEGDAKVALPRWHGRAERRAWALGKRRAQVRM